jgi:hypothetical protein
MSRLGLAAIALAGCSATATGIDVEIESDIAIDSVEVFTATAQCEGACGDEGVSWLVDQPRPEGQTFVTAQPAQRILPRNDGGTFVLHLEPTEGTTYVPALVIVGFDANNTPVSVADFGGVDFDASGGEHWRVELVAADPVKAIPGGNPGDAPTDRVGVWGREDASGELIPDAVRCVGVQHWTGNAWEGTFIVPEDDLDCDGETIECDDRYANLNQTTGPNQCLGLDSAGVSCRLGKSLCEDGVSDDATCNPIELGTGNSMCVSDELCNQCADPFGLVACVGLAVRRVSAVGHVECHFAPDPETGKPCTTGAGALVAITLPTTCTLPELRALTAPFDAVFNSSPTIEGQTFHTSQTADACTIYVEWTASTIQDNRVWTMLALSSDVVAPVRLVPVRFDFDGSVDCATAGDAPIECDVSQVVEDNVLECSP